MKLKNRRFTVKGMDPLNCIEVIAARIIKTRFEVNGRLQDARIVECEFCQKDFPIHEITTIRKHLVSHGAFSVEKKGDHYTVALS